MFIDRVTTDGADLAVLLRGIVSIPRIALPSRTGMVDIGFAAGSVEEALRAGFI